MRPEDEWGYNYLKKLVTHRKKRKALEKEVISAARNWAIPVPHAEQCSYEKFIKTDEQLLKTVKMLEEHIEKHGEKI
jgi:hypothetical protein